MCSQETKSQQRAVRTFQCGCRKINSEKKKEPQGGGVATDRQTTGRHYRVTCRGAPCEQQGATKKHQCTSAWNNRCTIVIQIRWFGDSEIISCLNTIDANISCVVWPPEELFSHDTKSVGVKRPLLHIKGTKIPFILRSAPRKLKRTCCWDIIYKKQTMCTKIFAPQVRCRQGVNTKCCWVDASHWC